MAADSEERLPLRSSSDSEHGMRERVRPKDSIGNHSKKTGMCVRCVFVGIEWGGAQGYKGTGCTRTAVRGRKKTRHWRRMETRRETTRRRKTRHWQPSDEGDS